MTVTEGLGKSRIAPTFSKWGYENNGTNKQQQPDFGKHDTSTHCPCVPSFNLLGLTVPEKSVTTKIINVGKLERKKNEKLKGQIRAAD